MYSSDKVAFKEGVRLSDDFGGCRGVLVIGGRTVDQSAYRRSVIRHSGAYRHSDDSDPTFRFGARLGRSARRTR